MTTNAEVIDQAMSRLGKRASTRLRADVLTEINAAIDAAEKAPFLPWFLQDLGSISATSSATSASLPADFLREEEDTRPYYVLSGTNYYLSKRLYNMLEGETPTSLSLYSIRGTTFYYKAAPSDALTIYLPYYKSVGGDLADDGSAVSNLWLLNARNYILAKALHMVASTVVRDDNLAREQAALRTDAWRDLVAFHESIQVENLDAYVGGASDGS